MTIPFFLSCAHTHNFLNKSNVPGELVICSHIVSYRRRWLSFFYFYSGLSVCLSPTPRYPTRRNPSGKDALLRTTDRPCFIRCTSSSWIFSLPNKLYEFSLSVLCKLRTFTTQQQQRWAGWQLLHLPDCLPASLDTQRLISLTRTQRESLLPQIPAPPSSFQAGSTACLSCDFQQND